MSIFPCQKSQTFFLKKSDRYKKSTALSQKNPSARILMAAIFGSALSLSGFFAADLFENPMPDHLYLHFLRCKMVVALTADLLSWKSSKITSYTLIIAAFIGSLISIDLSFDFKKDQIWLPLLVAGIMISYICSAVTDFVVTFADDDIVNLHGWSQGSFSV